MRKLVFILIAMIVFFNPWEEVAAVSAAGTLSRMTGYLAMTLAAVCLLLTGDIRRWHPVMWLIAAFFSWNAVSLLWTVSVPATLDRVNTDAALFALIWLIWEFANLPGQQRGLLHAYIAGCFVSAVMLLLSWAGGNQAAGALYTRYSGGGIDCNELALMLATAIAMGVYLASTASGGPRNPSRLYWLLIPFFIFSIFLTGSRGGVAATAFMLAALLLFRRQGGWKGRLLFAGIAVLAAALVWTCTPPALLERLTETSDAGTFQHRWQYWQAALARWFDDPLLGVGAGAGPDSTLRLLGSVRVLSHNTYVSLLLETGLAGCLLVAAVLAGVAGAIRAIPGEHRFLSLALLGIWLIGALSLTLDYKKSIWVVIALILVQSAVRAKAPPPQPRRS